MTVAIWWIRRDLRLADNAALAATMAVSAQVVPLFIIDPALQVSPYVGEKRLAFLWGGLQQLDAELRRRGSRLIVRQGEPRGVLAQVVAETGARGIYAEEDFSPYARRRDTAVAQTLPLFLCPGLVVHHPHDVLKPDGRPYTVFTPYSRAWWARPFPTPEDLLPAPRYMPTPAFLASLPIPIPPRLSPPLPFAPGEAVARQRLVLFMAEQIADYGRHRDIMSLQGTSTLSPYLRLGMVSARQAMVAAQQAPQQQPNAQAGSETWLNELIWREFYQGVLYHFPQARTSNFRPQYDKVQWRNDVAGFVAWSNGRTGYPIVDAAMRQLQQTGWLHNRARMIVASFLVKDLLIDWRWGEKWFMQQLLDGDPAANNGGWQWVAGTGTDAAPYFRIFNPISQGQKFDPDGLYIRRWLPELRYVPTAFIHEPWRMSAWEQKQSQCLIGQDYPQPIVDHKLARKRTLEAYKLQAYKPGNGVNNV